MCKIAENCVKIYKFTTDSTFTFSSCEMEDVYFGNFYFEDNFLMLEEKGRVSDKSISEAERKLYKIIIKGNELRHISVSDWVDKEWIRSNFKFDDI